MGFQSLAKTTSVTARGDKSVDFHIAGSYKRKESNKGFKSNITPETRSLGGCGREDTSANCSHHITSQHRGYSGSEHEARREGFVLK